MDEVAQLRQFALSEAVKLHKDREFTGTHTAAGQVVAAAEKFFGFLNEAAPTARLAFSIVLITDQATGSPSPHQYSGGIPTMLDTEQLVIAVQAEDSKGAPTSDSLTWSAPGDVTGAVLTPSADTMSCTVAAGTPGIVPVQAVDPNGVTGLSPVTVTAGAATQLVLTQGTPTPQGA
jgi:hypothetical protein